MDKLRLSLEAQYIGGYSVECSLKALILETTAEAGRPAMHNKLTHGATYHKPEHLLPLLTLQRSESFEFSFSFPV